VLAQADQLGRFGQLSQVLAHGLADQCGIGFGILAQLMLDCGINRLVSCG
jgi:hypothetical protein